MRLIFVMALALMTLSACLSAEEHKPVPVVPAASVAARESPRKLIVIGFLGGNVSASNLVHREAQLIRTLQSHYPLRVHAEAFANRDGDAALQTILNLLDEDKDGHLSDEDKSAARIV